MCKKIGEVRGSSSSQLLCGVVSLVVLGCLGLYPDELSTCLFVGGLLEGHGVLWCRK